MRLRLASISVGLIAVAGLAACGDDGKDLGPYVDAIAADLAAPPDDDSPPLSQEQARCAAEKAIDVIPEDKITAFDTPEALVAATKENLVALDLDDKTLDEFSGEFVTCLGGMDFFLKALGDFGMTDEQLDCVRESITEDDFVASVRADLDGGTDEQFDSKLGVCIGG